MFTNRIKKKYVIISGYMNQIKHKYSDERFHDHYVGYDEYIITEKVGTWVYCIV